MSMKVRIRNTQHKIPEKKINTVSTKNIFKFFAIVYIPLSIIFTVLSKDFWLVSTTIISSSILYFTLALFYKEWIEIYTWILSKKSRKSRKTIKNTSIKPTLYKKDKNFLNHHNYLKRPDLREIYNTTIWQSMIESAKKQARFITLIIFIFVFLISILNFWIAFLSAIVFYMPLRFFFFLAVVKRYFLNIKKEKLHVYTQKLWEIQHFYKEWKNIFFY